MSNKPEYEAALKNLLNSTIKHLVDLQEIDENPEDAKLTWKQVEHWISQVQVLCPTKLCSEIPLTRRMGITSKNMTTDQRREYKKRSEAEAVVRYRRAYAAEKANAEVHEEARKKERARITADRDVHLDELTLSNRAYNCLRRQGITTLKELSSYTKEELWNIRSFSTNCQREIEDALAANGFSLRESS